MFEIEKFPCPCCGHLVFDREPGSHGVCPICLWEDDLAQLRFPRMPGSSNQVSLEEAQRNFQAFGTAERRNRGLGRAPVESEAEEGGWRMLDPRVDNIEEPRRGERYAETYPWRDPTVLYYWRSTYWRKVSG
jgi:hypothetical protein